ncbi:DUF2147 domain-containing protein [Mucilaginibacter litoreus]|uniref:DUF2147 domain-containing protein n=1 Tax=Mucilaginibacter litoreus TaxID=1048221 RepID=A0ABW3AQ64_9SPHI
MRYLYILLFTLVCTFKNTDPDEAFATRANRICGKWQSTEKNLVVEVYPYKNTFKAKIVWFSGGVTPDKPMESITDKKNPDPALRNRKVLGLDVVENLKYSPRSNSWEGGKIYEVQSGKYWNAAAALDNSGDLKVKGYWKLKLFGKTMNFKRI